MPKSRKRCVSNRNTNIIGRYTKKQLGSLAGVFDNLEYPKEESGKKFKSAEEFYLWEHGWHTLETYNTVYRRLRNLLGPETYFNCGSSVLKNHSLGLFLDTKNALGGISGIIVDYKSGNKVFNDTKEVHFIKKFINKDTKLLESYAAIKFHDDIRPEDDYISEPHTRGIWTQAPCIWGLPPGKVTHPLLPYDLVKLCEVEPEFSTLNLNPKYMDDSIVVKINDSAEYKTYADKVYLIPSAEFPLDFIDGDPVYLGEYETQYKTQKGTRDENEIAPHYGYLTKFPIMTGDYELIPEGTILGAPYILFKLECQPDPGKIRAFINSIKFKIEPEKSSQGNVTLMDTLIQYSKENETAHKAMDDLEKANKKLQDYADHLEDKVEERTKELKEAQSQLVHSEKMAGIGVLAAGVAHEINNPIAAISSNIENINEYITKVITAWAKVIITTDRSNVEEILELYMMIDKIGGRSKSVSRLYIMNIRKNLETNFKANGIDRSFAKNLAEIAVNEDIQTRLLSVLKKTNIPELVELFVNGYKVRKMVSNSIPASRKITDIVTALTRYSHLDREPVGEVNINESIDETLVILSAKLTGIEVIKSYADLENTKVYVNELNQVWTNIISNACDAVNDSLNKSKKQIWITTSNKGNEITVNISNNGPKIPEDIRDKIFDQFFTTKRVGDGTGLGLSISYNIVKKHNGMIEVKSSDEKTDFIITIHPLEER